MITDSMIRGIGMTSARTRERLVKRLFDKGVRDRRVLEVVRDTPRHLFVDEALASRAYEDTALPIGHGQTISQPYIVARMTELLIQRQVPSRVLEIGTGCGYQSAILSALADEVFSVERIESLLQQTRRRLRSLRLPNIRLKHSDGSWGWESKAPFDGILVTAAPASVPEPLLKQLAPGGRLVLPVGAAGDQQQLVVIDHTADGFEQEIFEPVSFVPLLGGRG